MIESISTLSVQSASLRYQSQAAVDSSATAPAVKAPEFATSRIRVDNLQDVAILEYLSQDGDVIRQYPTESQIAAFKRAESLVPASDNADPAQGNKSSSKVASFAAVDEAKASAPTSQTRQSVAPSTYSPAGNAGSGAGQQASTQSLIA